MNGRDNEWWHSAACRGLDTEMFFTGEREPQEARQICNSCPVRAECLRDVLKNEVDEYRFGVWAGLTPIERKKLMKSQRQRQLVRN